MCLPDGYLPKWEYRWEVSGSYQQNDVLHRLFASGQYELASVSQFGSFDGHSDRL